VQQRHRGPQGECLVAVFAGVLDPHGSISAVLLAAPCQEMDCQTFTTVTPGSSAVSISNWTKWTAVGLHWRTSSKKTGPHLPHLPLVSFRDPIARFQKHRGKQDHRHLASSPVLGAGRSSSWLRPTPLEARPQGSRLTASVGKPFDQHPKWVSVASSCFSSITTGRASGVAPTRSILPQPVSSLFLERHWHVWMKRQTRWKRLHVWRPPGAPALPDQFSSSRPGQPDRASARSSS
jgi:hypothetical protein